jgi:hypothetical protein
MEMQENMTIYIKCVYCDIMLLGREQFVGHMIHSHDVILDTAILDWKSLSTTAHNIH